MKKEKSKKKEKDVTKFEVVTGKRKKSPEKEAANKRINAYNSPSKRLHYLNNFLMGIRPEPEEIILTESESEDDSNTEDDLNQSTATVIGKDTIDQPKDDENKGEETTIGKEKTKSNKENHLSNNTHIK